MTEFRRDPIVGQWVLVHTDDSLTPSDFEKEDHILYQQAICQFCSGREHFTPPEVDSIRLNGSAPNQSGWNVRVVPNKFPALRIEGNIDKRLTGMFEMANGVGAHEVVIETPDHTKQMADLTQEDVFNVIKKYQSRLNDLTGDKRFKYIVIFKNYGESAGASIEHSHSQIIALPMIPQHVLDELRGTITYFDQHQRCVYCDIVQQEYTDKERLVTENKDFITICPFVSRYPFECWILPKKHSSQFNTLSDDERRSLAAILRETLLRIKVCLSDPSYNYYLHIPPINFEEHETISIDKESDLSVKSSWFQRYHWHMEIVPNLSKISGFEWGTGFYVVRTSPSVAAKCLREVSIKG